jgi:chromosome partitioning protein
LDILSSDEIGDIVKEVRSHNKKLRAKLLVSRKIVGTTPGREAREALQRYKMGIFDTEISQRVAYVKALIAGQSVLEFEPNSEAAIEIKSLCDEIIK